MIDNSKERPSLVGLGAGGHCKVVIEILNLLGQYEIFGLLDRDPELAGKTIQGVKILGDDSLLHQLAEQGIKSFFVGLGSAGDAKPRKTLFEKASEFNLDPVEVIHPRSVISASAHMGRGTQVMANAVINPSAIMGINNIINTGAIVEHDCILGDHVHVATGARLASSVKVGDMAHIGAGATVRQLINIGEEAVVGAGAVVVKDVPAGHTVIGNPAKRLKK
jgi:UDP-perosamine 4-acetyltransferase